MLPPENVYLGESCQEFTWARWVGVSDSWYSDTRDYRVPAIMDGGVRFAAACVNINKPPFL